VTSSKVIEADKSSRKKMNVKTLLEKNINQAHKKKLKTVIE